MSEISITRFQPAVVAREKVNSVQAVENEVGAEHTDNTPDDKGSGKQGSGRQESGRQTATNRESETHGNGKNTTAVQSDHADASAEEILEQAVTKLNRYVQTVKRDIVFDIDPLSQEPSVTVVDRESRKILRQFDSKEALELAKQIDTEEPISLFKTQV
ncbi:flagellar protein FlaG [Pseudohongiella sp.]|uniref:Flagellar protein FlaG protein n=1 Tax=marine sediment metagenome TaxID=412755 RepID=A0A0F9Z392_9ZZZZ|nr:flagellar protein FlaG [Pseudohongiella sp.]